jgi:hypothetical protein
MCESGRTLGSVVDVTVSPAGPLVSVGRKLMVPALEFGSPVCRARSDREAFWHIPNYDPPRAIQKKAVRRAFRSAGHILIYTGGISKLWAAAMDDVACLP